MKTLNQDSEKIYQALVDLTEVVYDLVFNSSNYSAVTARKFGKVLSSINKLNKKKLKQKSAGRMYEIFY